MSACHKFATIALAWIALGPLALSALAGDEPAPAAPLLHVARI